MDFGSMTDNILRTYVLSSDADIDDGIEWYARALRLATELDPHNPRRAVGIIAVLSPLTSWPQNMRRAREVYANNGVTKGLPDSIAKAKRIYDGESPDSVVSGAKVTSFFHNILGDDVPVTVDRHAIDCAFGRVMSDKERGKAVAGKRYNVIRDAYKHVAQIISDETGKIVTGAQMQAIVWVYWRRNVIAANHGDA